MQGPQAPGGYGPDGGAAGQYPPQQPQQYPAAPPQQHYAGAAQTYAGGPPQDHASAYPPAGAGQGGGPGAAYAGPNGALPGAPAGGVKRRFEDAVVGPVGAVGPEYKRQAPSGAAGHYGTPSGPETVLRLLVSAKRVGSVIGKGGSIVKQIRDETGCRVRVVDGVPTCDERVVIISAPDEASEVEHSAAQRGLYEVHRLASEGDEHLPGGSDRPGERGMLTRLLVCHSQAGSIIGKSGLIVKQMREDSGAHIKILNPEDLPPCALSNDRIVQIVGEPAAVQTALHLVSKQIRENPPKERPGGPPMSLTQLTGGAMAPGPAQLQGFANPGGASRPTLGGFGAQARKTMEVPQSSVGSIIGSSGSNINRIRQETGAKIKLFDDATPDGNRLIEMAGTADQVAAAEAAIAPYAAGEAPYY